MPEQPSWEDIVDTLRFDKRINTKELSRDIGRSIAELKTGPDLKGCAERLVNLLLLRLAVKEAFSPDTEQRHQELVLPYYIRPLRDIGLWDGTWGPPPPCPPTLPTERVGALSELLDRYATAYDQTPEDDEATLMEAVGITPGYSRSFERVEGLFGADNAAALCKEGNVLANLYGSPYPEGSNLGYRRLFQ